MSRISRLRSRFAFGGRFSRRKRQNPHVERNLNGNREDAGEARNTLSVRFAGAERAQIAAAAGLSGMPLSSWVRCAALQASAVATGRASVAPPRPPERKPTVMLELAPEPPARAHHVDGELVRR